jgi:hypothetical protein
MADVSRQQDERVRLGDRGDRNVGEARMKSLRRRPVGERAGDGRGLEVERQDAIASRCSTATHHAWRLAALRVAPSRAALATPARISVAVMTVSLGEVGGLGGGSGQKVAQARNVGHASPSLPGDDDGRLVAVAGDDEFCAAQGVVDDRGEPGFGVLQLNLAYESSRIFGVNAPIAPKSGFRSHFTLLFSEGFGGALTTARLCGALTTARQDAT